MAGGVDGCASEGIGGSGMSRFGRVVGCYAARRVEVARARRGRCRPRAGTARAVRSVGQLLPVHCGSLGTTAIPDGRDASTERLVTYTPLGPKQENDTLR